MRPIRTFVLPFMMILMATSVMASSPVWHWKSLSSGINSWASRDGTATVSTVGGHFEALLLDGSDGLPAYSLKGTKSGDAIEVKATISDSDVPAIYLKGKRRINHWPEAGGGRETIVLTDGFEVIALTRELAV